MVVTGRFFHQYTSQALAMVSATSHRLAPNGTHPDTETGSFVQAFARSDISLEYLELQSIKTPREVRELTGLSAIWRWLVHPIVSTLGDPCTL